MGRGTIRRGLTGVLTATALAGVSGRVLAQEDGSEGARFFVLAATEVTEPGRFGAGVSYRPVALRRSIGPIGGGIEAGLGAQRASDGGLILALSGGLGSFVTASPLLSRVIPFAWGSGGVLMLRQPERVRVGLSAALGAGFFVTVTDRSGIMAQARGGVVALAHVRRALSMSYEIGYALFVP
mgnify:CR=1 FL=1